MRRRLHDEANARGAGGGSCSRGCCSADHAQLCAAAKRRSRTKSQRSGGAESACFAPQHRSPMAGRAQLAFARVLRPRPALSCSAEAGRWPRMRLMLPLCSAPRPAHATPRRPRRRGVGQIGGAASRPTPPLPSTRPQSSCCCSFASEQSLLPRRSAGCSSRALLLLASGLPRAAGEAAATSRAGVDGVAALAARRRSRASLPAARSDTRAPTAQSARLVDRRPSHVAAVRSALCAAVFVLGIPVTEGAAPRGLGGLKSRRWPRSSWRPLRSTGGAASARGALLVGCRRLSVADPSFSSTTLAPRRDQLRRRARVAPRAARTGAGPLVEPRVARPRPWSPPRAAGVRVAALRVDAAGLGLAAAPPRAADGRRVASACRALGTVARRRRRARCGHAAAGHAAPRGPRPTRCRGLAHCRVDRAAIGLAPPPGCRRAPSPRRPPAAVVAN